MGYIDYEYYKTHSLNPIDETYFNHYLPIATLFIQEKTLKKSDSYEGDELKLCMVEVIDKMYSFDYSDEYKLGNSKGVTSEKVGEYSVSYGSSIDLENTKTKELKDILVKYLALTGLLYRGQDVH